MSSFRQLKSVLRLSELAIDPIDLSMDGVFSSKRIEGMVAQALNFKLLYAGQRVMETTMHALFDLAEETQAVEKMAAMQKGSVVNFIEGHESERRPALHTATRDFFEGAQTAPPAHEAAKLAYQELEKLKHFLYEIEKKKNFTDIVQVGIGGSDLGPRAIYLALEAYQKEGRRAHFISNVDPDDGAAVFRGLDLSKTLFVIVSKSGSTLETKTNEAWVKEHLEKAGLTPRHHLISVTGKGSPMDDPKAYLASFYIWDYIGGRYSVTSMVGAVTLAFTLGMDRFLDFLRGAHAMDRVALQPEARHNLPLLGALFAIWNRNFLDLATCAVIPYAQALSRFPAHLQQLEMESNGKRVDKQGRFVDFETSPVIWGETGTNGQHSFYQMIHQGTETVSLDLIGFIESQYEDDVIYQGTSCQEKLLANLFAQSIALAAGQKNSNPNKVCPGNRPNSVLLAPKLDPFNMGALLAYYEHKVAFQGFIWNINSFDQEGVELGKVLASKLIEQMAQRRQGKPVDSKLFPQGAAYLSQLP